MQSIPGFVMQKDTNLKRGRGRGPLVKMTSQMKLSIASKLTRKLWTTKFLNSGPIIVMGLRIFLVMERNNGLKNWCNLSKQVRQTWNLCWYHFFLSWRRMLKLTCKYQHLYKCLHISYITLTLPNIHGCNEWYQQALPIEII